MKRLSYFFFILMVSAPQLLYAQEPLADLIARVKPSVARVMVYDDSGGLTKSGTGFFISKTQMITNRHVVNGAKRIDVKLFDETVLHANKVQDLPNLDISILTFSRNNLFIKPLQVAATRPRVGDSVIVFGSPLGLEGSVSDGIVSAFRELDDRIYLQMTAPISPGSSGSPVLDRNGNVVGVATLNIRGGQNLNFAVPVESFSSHILNPTNLNDTLPSTVRAVNEPTRANTDLTGEWENLMNGTRATLVDDGKQISFGNRLYEWNGDIAIAYDPSFKYFWAIKILGPNRIGQWVSAKLRITDSNERILRTLTKNTRAKPYAIWQTSK